MPFLSKTKTDPPELIDGAVIDHDTQTLIAKKRSQREVARIQSEVMWWRGTALVCGLGVLLAGMGWRRAEQRWANDVRIAWVKVQPDGRSEAALWNDGGNANRFFAPFVHSALINFVEHRYRHIRATIESDYGVAYMFMSPDMQRAFLDHGAAAKEAADFAACSGCEEYELIVKAIDDTTLVNPDAANRDTVVVDSTVYVTKHYLRAGHKDEQMIVKLTWKLTPLENLQRDWQQLKLNGPGVEILSSHIVSALDQEQ